MAHKSYSASAPGSLMLLGEHAVLNGKQALVCAIQQRLQVALLPNNTQIITIKDTRLGTLEVPLTDFAVQAPFTHVLNVINLYKHMLPSGFTLEISSEFASNLGFGSSAAVTVATLAVLSSWLQPLSNNQLFDLAQQINVGGSGADLAASIYGGTLCYAMGYGVMQRLPSIPVLTAVYCGYKTPTSEVVKMVNQAKRQHPNLYANIFAAMHDCVTQAIQILKDGNWTELGKIFTKHHYLQVALGVSNQLLDTIAHTLDELPEIAGAKISGAGLGDCVIGLGRLDAQIFTTNGQQQFHVTTTDQGLIYDNN